MSFSYLQCIIRSSTLNEYPSSLSSILVPVPGVSKECPLDVVFFESVSETQNPEEMCSYITQPFTFHFPVKFIKFVLQIQICIKLATALTWRT